MIILPVDESVHIFTLGPTAGNFCWCQQSEYNVQRKSSIQHEILEDQIFIVREPAGQAGAVLYFHMDNFMCCCQKGYHARCLGSNLWSGCRGFDN
ncbi:putative 4-phytase [Helianthus anomalus]